MIHPVSNSLQIVVPTYGDPCTIFETLKAKVNAFLAMFPFEPPENLSLSFVFRGSKIGIWARNELKYLPKFI